MNTMTVLRTTVSAMTTMNTVYIATKWKCDHFSFISLALNDFGLLLTLIVLKVMIFGRCLNMKW